MTEEEEDDIFDLGQFLRITCPDCGHEEVNFTIVAEVTGDEGQFEAQPQEPERFAMPCPKCSGIRAVGVETDMPADWKWPWERE